MRILLSLLLCIGLLVGCKKAKPSDPNDTDGVAYYKFTADDLARIPQFKQGDNVVFKDQSHQKLHRKACCN